MGSVTGEEWRGNEVKHVGAHTGKMYQTEASGYKQKGTGTDWRE